MWHFGINSNMNFPAPVAALGFMAAFAGTALSVCALAAALFVRKAQIAMLTLIVVACAATVYFGLLFGFSLGSRDNLLAKGEEKYFCEMDCHLAYSILDVKTEPAPASMRYLVTLRTRFDETTTSSHRPKDAPLTPGPRTLQLLDAQGTQYPLDSTAGTSLSASLIPGQSYTTQLAFQVPSDAKGLRLLIRSTPQWPDHVIIGDENSWLHH